MKTVTINRNSWHFWLANKWEFGYADFAGDFCAYLWSVIIGGMAMLLLALSVSVVAGGLFWAAGDFLGWLLVGLLNRFVEPYIGVKVFLLLSIFAALVGAGVGIKVTVKSVADHQPQFLREAYTSFKDRVCYRVEFK